MINLCLVVIATQFSETKKRETERMLQERKHNHSSSTLTSNAEIGNCYDEIMRYLAHLGRKAKRKVRTFLRGIAQIYGCVKPEQTVTITLRHRKKKSKRNCNKYLAVDNHQDLQPPNSAVAPAVVNSTVDGDSKHNLVIPCDSSNLSDGSTEVNKYTNGYPNFHCKDLVNRIKSSNGGMDAMTMLCCDIENSEKYQTTSVEENDDVFVLSGKSFSFLPFFVCFSCLCFDYFLVSSAHLCLLFCLSVSCIVLCCQRFLI